MSTSSAQLAANAANAQHSTGPRTSEGKNRSSQNASKHGLTAREVVIPPGEQEELTIYSLITKPTSNPKAPSSKLCSINW